MSSPFVSRLKRRGISIFFFPPVDLKRFVKYIKDEGRAVSDNVERGRSEWSSASEVASSQCRWTASENSFLHFHTAAAVLGG